MASSISDEMTRTLRTMLRIPHASRPVSDFLFSALLQTPFHPAHPLPPSALSTSLAIASAHTLDPTPNALYPPVAAHRPMPEHLLSATLSTEPVDSQMHSIFIPVAAFQSYIVGYVFNHDPDHTSICFRANPFAPPFVARFVFDKRSSDMLFVVYGGSPASIGLRATVSTPLQIREQYILAVPAMEYDWPYLPSSGLWMVTSVEMRLSNLAFPSHAQGKRLSLSNNNLAELNVIDKALCPDPFPSHWMSLAEPLASHQPCIMSSAGALADGTEPVRSPAVTLPDDGVANAAFSIVAIQMGIAHLVKAISGSFYTPSLRMDSPNANPFEFTSPFTSSFTGRSSSLLTVASNALAVQLRERFASLYYLSVLSVSTDARLLPSQKLPFHARPPSCPDCNAIIARHPQPVAGILHDVETDTIDQLHNLDSCLDADAFSIWLPEDVSLTRSSTRSVTPKRLKPLAPRPDPVDSVTETRVSEEKIAILSHQSNSECACQAHYPDRQAMLSARRERNRLSAARSNDRKKAWIEALEREVDDNRRKVAELSEKRHAVAEENKLLKSQLLLKSFET